MFQANECSNVPFLPAYFIEIKFLWIERHKDIKMNRRIKTNFLSMNSLLVYKALIKRKLVRVDRWDFYHEHIVSSIVAIQK